MSSEASPKGKLIAVEGAGGQELRLTARRLRRCFCRGEQQGRISHWNASGIFAAVRLGDPNIPPPSPRTLVLLYAADLAFRLRWEISPALQQGHCVIAAPYIQTGMAFGKAAGLPRPWLLELFRFAPKAGACYRPRERAAAGGSKGKATDGYLEFCYAALVPVSLPDEVLEFRGRFRAYLDALERRRGCEAVTRQLLAAADSAR